MEYEPTIYTAKDGAWIVGTRLANGQIATVKGDTRYASEATATLAAIAQKRARPHMNFAVVAA